MDRRTAKVGFIVRASESLLSDGRRLLREGVCAPWRGKGDGHRVLRGASREEVEAWEPLREWKLGRLSVVLWLLSVRANSELVFRFSTTSPPAMMTGAILDIRNGSLDRLPKLSCDDIVPGITRAVFEMLVLLLRTNPSFP
jgi:hypothetical protein